MGGRVIQTLSGHLMWISLGRVSGAGDGAGHAVTECFPSRAKTLSGLIRFRSLSQGVLSSLVRFFVVAVFFEVQNCTRYTKYTKYANVSVFHSPSVETPSSQIFSGLGSGVLEGGHHFSG